MNNIKSILNFPAFSNASIILRPVFPELFAVRFAGHKVKRGTRQKAKQPGVKRMDGDFVRKGEIIVKQFQLHFHPGLNVEIDTDNTLKAMREGVVMLTCERINPKKDNYVAEKYYANLASPVVHKRYFNVVPFKQGQKFKLVDLV